jgi:hypothetical protein
MSGAQHLSPDLPSCSSSAVWSGTRSVRRISNEWSPIGDEVPVGIRNEIGVYRDLS